MHTLSASVPESAIDGIALVVASALAPIAASLSGDQAAASSADPTATTEADARNSVSHEPIVVARKPLVGTVAGNVLAHGTGAINVDGCRVEASGRPLIVSASEDSTGIFGDGLNGSRHGGTTNVGRWPANTILGHAPDCDPDGGCGAGCPCAEMDAQSGERPGFSTQRDITARGGTDGTTTYGVGVGRLAPGIREGFNDTGGASRFFPAFYYTAKASSAERPRGDGVAHPTVKPLDLMRWLVRLVTPPGGVVLEPFAGSGTTAEACVVEGFRCIAIEREADYLPLIEARLTKPIERTLL
jgi:site-specific DNA-methyltransferase (adenine-specific)